MSRCTSSNLPSFSIATRSIALPFSKISYQEFICILWRVTWRLGAVGSTIRMLDIFSGEPFTPKYFSRPLAESPRPCRKISVYLCSADGST